MFSDRPTEESYSTALDKIRKAHAENAQIIALQSLIAVLQEELKWRWPAYHPKETQENFTNILAKMRKTENLSNVIKYSKYSEAYADSKENNAETFKFKLEGLINHIYLSSFFSFFRGKKSQRVLNLEDSIEQIISGVKSATAEENNSGTIQTRRQNSTCAIYQSVATHDTALNQTKLQQQDPSSTFKSKLKAQLVDIVKERNSKANTQLNNELTAIYEKIKALNPEDNSQTPDNFITEILALRDELKTASERPWGGSATLTKLFKHRFVYTQAELETCYSTLQEYEHNPEQGELNTIFKKNLKNQLTSLIKKAEKKPYSKKIQKIINEIKALSTGDHSQSAEAFIEKILALKDKLRATSKHWIGGSKTLADMLKYGFNYIKTDLTRSWAELNSQENSDQLQAAKPATTEPQSPKPQARPKADDTRATRQSHAPSAFDEATHQAKGKPETGPRSATGKKVSNHRNELPTSPAAQLPETHSRATSQLQSQPEQRAPIPPAEREELAPLTEAASKKLFHKYVNENFAYTGLEGLIFSSEDPNDGTLSNRVENNATAKWAITAMTQAIDRESTKETQELIFSITALFIYQNVTAPENAQKLGNPINQLLTLLNDSNSREQLESITAAESFKPLCYEKRVFTYSEDLTTFGELTTNLVAKTAFLSTNLTLPAGRLATFIQTIQNLQKDVCTTNAQTAESSAAAPLVSDATRQRVGEAGAIIQAGAQNFWSGLMNAGEDAKRKFAQQAKLTLASVNAENPADTKQTTYRSIENK